MEHRFHCWTAPVLLSAFLTSACTLDGIGEGTASAEEPATIQSALETAAAGTLVEFELHGAKISFVELSPGSVIIYAETKDGVANPLAPFKDLDLLDKYQQMTGKTPPPALVAAQARREAIEREPLSPEEQAEARNETVEPQNLAMIASEFQTKLCGGMKICAVDQTANREWGPVRVDRADGYVNVTEGNVALQVRDRRVRGWSNDQYHHLVKGAVFNWEYRAPRQEFQLKVAVYEVDAGDSYHFSMWW